MGLLVTIKFHETLGISVTLVFFTVVNIYAMLKKFGMYACLSQGDDLNIPLGIVYFADGIM